jgi:hypothetical protein
MATMAIHRPELLDVPERTVLMADGTGDPNGSEAFQAAVNALFSVSYGLRFGFLREIGVDRKVGPLEGLWSVEGNDFTSEDRSGWRWTVLIDQADEVTSDRVEAIRRDKGIEVALRLERLAEGRVAQVLHVGPFADEPPTIARLHAFIAEQGLRPAGRHHEIYLSDMRRVAPERMRTLLRQPVARA